MQYSACRSVPPGAWWTEHDPDVFFPELGGLESMNRARWSCFVCPVKVECLDYKKRTHSEYGMWAGEFSTKVTSDDGPESWSETWFLYLDLVPEKVKKK